MTCFLLNVAFASRYYQSQIKKVKIFKQMEPVYVPAIQLSCFSSEQSKNTEK